MFAVKGNRQYTITEAEKASYIAKGYDIIDDEGFVIANGIGKAVPYSKYQEVLEENKALKASSNNEAAKELKAAQKQIKALETELAELKKPVDPDNPVDPVDSK